MKCERIPRVFGIKGVAMTSNLQLFVQASMAPEVRLPETRPLTLTRNFSYVFFFCLAALLTAPVMIAWVAGMLLS
jgi:hypothetical protein